ncbi:unnamed protein product, partial [Coregonus sp. 'balchen']
MSSLSSPPTMTPGGEGCKGKGWGRLDEEEERRGSRKKVRIRGSHREHSDDESIKVPQEGNRQRSCSAPNLRRSPRHSPAVPGVPSLTEMVENEDGCYTTEPERRADASPSQSYLCIPFHREGPVADGSNAGGGGEYCPSYHSTPAPDTPPSRKSPGGRGRSELVLLGCGALLAAVGLGFNMTTLAQPGTGSGSGAGTEGAGESSKPPRWEGFFHRTGTGAQRRSTSPPTRKLFRRGGDKESPLKHSVAPVTERVGGGLFPSSLTLLSLSSVSDCNSMRSLLRSDSEELLVYRPASPRAPVQPVQPQLQPQTLVHPEPQPQHAPLNPLVNTHLESFKRHPRQSLTPTHLPSAPSSSRCLHRTPSDGAIKTRCPPNYIHPFPLPVRATLETTAGGLRGLSDHVSQVPRLPDPNLVFPPTPRRRCPPERPKTLDFLVRPRPSPRVRCDVFSGQSPGRGRGGGQGQGNGESPAHTTSTDTPPTVEFGRDMTALPTPLELPTPSPRRGHSLEAPTPSPRRGHPMLTHHMEVLATPMEPPTPCSTSPRRRGDSLLDQHDEEQCLDPTLPLCKPESQFPKCSPYRYRPGFWS